MTCITGKAISLPKVLFHWWWWFVRDTWPSY